MILFPTQSPLAAAGWFQRSTVEAPLFEAACLLHYAAASSPVTPAYADALEGAIGTSAMWEAKERLVRVLQGIPESDWGILASQLPESGGGRKISKSRPGKKTARREMTVHSDDPVDMIVALRSWGQELLFPDGTRLHRDAAREKTVITVGQAPMEWLHNFARAFRFINTGVPLSGRRDNFGVTEAMEVILPADFSRRVHRWAFGVLNHFQESHRVKIDRLLKFHERIVQGEALGGEERRELESFARVVDGIYTKFLSCLRYLRWLSQHVSPSRMEFEYRGVFHNAIRRPMWLRGLHSCIKSVADGREAREIRFFSTGGSAVDVDSMIGEGIELAAGEARHYARYPNLPRIFSSSHLKSLEAVAEITDVIANLVANGARYANPGLPADERRVDLDVEILPGGAVEITVRDNGIGMSAEFVETRLGLPEGREGRKPVKESQGLGVHSILETLRRFGMGPLWVRSEVGHGSDFRFVIPAEMVDWPEAPTPTVPESSEGDGRNFSGFRPITPM